MRQAGSGGRRQIAFVFAFLSLVGATGLSAQGVPSEFTNLKVLPEDITRREIVSIMRTMVGDVGGGTCSYYG
jgi:hypothetical protein